MSVSDRDFEALSAYLDGELAGKALARMEARLQTNQELQDAYEQLQRTRTVIRSLPKMRAPRNYLLTPEMAGISQKPPRAFPVLRLASILATFILVLVFMGDIFVLPDLVMSPPETIQLAEIAVEKAIQPTMEADIVESQLPEAPMEAPMEADMEADMEDRAILEGEAPLAAAEAPPAAEAIIAPEEEAAEEAETKYAAPVEELANELGGLAERAEEPQLEIETPEPEPQIDPDVPTGIDLRAVIRLTELALIVIALSTGLTAFYLYRKFK
jgi:hypothetical protein